MPVDFLTTEQTESYGRFTGEPDELQLARYFHLDEADKEFIGKSRGDHNRPGITLQIGCVRFLGTFLTNMNHITLALDDALDVLDAMLAVIIRDARKIGQKKRLRSLKDLDKSALALASACSYLLKEETPDESIRTEVFSHIPRQKLADIIALVREIARPSDDNFHDEKVEQYGRVRRFLPRLLNTVKFSAAPAGSATLNACDYLSREFSSRRQYFGDAPTEIISRPWKRLVVNKEKHITRKGYTLCFLSKLQDSLRRRDVYVTGSNRWGDPREKLLQGADW